MGPDQTQHRIVEERFVAELAKAMGPGSVSAKLMRELQERRAAGEDVVLIEEKSRLSVVPGGVAQVREA